MSSSDTEIDMLLFSREDAIDVLNRRSGSECSSLTTSFKLLPPFCEDGSLTFNVANFYGLSGPPSIIEGAGSINVHTQFKYMIILLIDKNYTINTENIYDYLCNLHIMSDCTN